MIPAAASRFVFTTGPQTIVAGVASGTITAALEDPFGNHVETTSGLTVSLSTTSVAGSFTPVSPLTIPAGGSIVSFHYTDTAAGTPALTVTGGGLSATQQETVISAAASHLTFTTKPQTIIAGISSGTITVALEDAFGNLVQGNSALTVSLSTNSGSGTFFPQSPVTIPAGASSISFQYTDTTAGTPTITAAAGSLTSATQQETVNPAAASRLAFTTAPQTIVAGVDSGTITAALEDAFGNHVQTASGLTVTLSTTSSTGAFSPNSPVTIPVGTAR